MSWEFGEWPSRRIAQPLLDFYGGNVMWKKTILTPRNNASNWWWKDSIQMDVCPRGLKNKLRGPLCMPRIPSSAKPALIRVYESNNDPHTSTWLSMKFSSVRMSFINSRRMPLPLQAQLLLPLLLVCCSISRSGDRKCLSRCEPTAALRCAHKSD